MMTNDLLVQMAYCKKSFDWQQTFLEKNVCYFLLPLLADIKWNQNYFKVVVLESKIV